MLKDRENKRQALWILIILLVLFAISAGSMIYLLAGGLQHG